VYGNRKKCKKRINNIQFYNPNKTALTEVLPSIAAKKVEKGGFLVLRPDSGDPVEAVLMVREESVYFDEIRMSNFWNTVLYVDI
jgi:hypothetical protein